MCRWQCPANNTTHLCKWCGIRFCKDCLIGAWPKEMGPMPNPTTCRICNQNKCLGNRVEYEPNPPKHWSHSLNEEGDGGEGGDGGKGKKSGKKSGKSGKESGKKGKKSAGSKKGKKGKKKK